MQYRYRVLSAWGEVPQEIYEMITKPDMFLVYDDYRGGEKDENLFDEKQGKVIGGWYIHYEGQRDAS